MRFLGTTWPTVAKSRFKNLGDKPIPTARREGPCEQSGLRGGGHRVWRYAAGGPPRSTLGN